MLCVCTGTIIKSHDSEVSHDDLSLCRHTELSYYSSGSSIDPLNIIQTIFYDERLIAVESIRVGRPPSLTTVRE